MWNRSEDAFIVGIADGLEKPRIDRRPSKLIIVRETFRGACHGPVFKSFATQPTIKGVAFKKRRRLAMQQNIWSRRDPDVAKIMGGDDEEGVAAWARRRASPASRSIVRKSLGNVI